MRPIHELLNRVRWDKEFGDADFELGYFDRVDDRVIRIALARAEFDHPEDEGFQLTDDEGRTVSIPFHRVRELWRNGELIWSRAPQAQPDAQTSAKVKP